MIRTQCEAVVLAAVVRYKGAVKLLDLREELPDGPWTAAEPLARWKVPDPEGVSLFRFYSRWQDVPAALKPPRGPLRETMFPEGPVRELRHCLRLLPNLQPGKGAGPCGGSFFALFGKDSHRAAHSADWTTTMPQGQPGETRPQKPPRFARQYSELDVEERQLLERFYGLDLQLLAGPGTLGVDCDAATASKPRSVCLLSPAAANAAIQHGGNFAAAQVHCIGSGLVLFSRLDSRFLKAVECRWRPTVEAAALLAAHAKRRVVHIDPPALMMLLQWRTIPLAGEHTDPHERSVAEAILLGRGCQALGGGLEPGGALVGDPGSGVWLPVVVTPKEVNLAADKDLAKLLLETAFQAYSHHM
mmetsp:Transcript_5281/g.14728  ORF Transcript_5281/g.14728 Transcript_5281/m.14728 type:complete len:359 (-) Transcript_5281:307-1383(-)